MKIVILDSGTVGSSDEIKWITNLFPNTEVISISSVFDVIHLYNSANIIHIPTHSTVNLLFFKKDVISGNTIGRIFPDAKLVFFNSCSSKDIANSSGAKATISWAHDVGDKYAVLFSNLFYTALNATKNIETAFDIACSQLLSNGYKELLPIYKEIKEDEVDETDKFNFNFYSIVGQVVGQIKRE